MPNIKSAVKRVKTSEARRLKNAANRSKLNTVRRSYLDAVASGDKAKAAISKNSADRRKGRAAAKLNAMA